MEVVVRDSALQAPSIRRALMKALSTTTERDEPATQTRLRSNARAARAAFAIPASGEIVLKFEVHQVSSSLPGIRFDRSMSLVLFGAKLSITTNGSANKADGLAASVVFGRENEIVALSPQTGSADPTRHVPLPEEVVRELSAALDLGFARAATAIVEQNAGRQAAPALGM